MTNNNQNMPNVPNLRFKGFEGEWELRILSDLGDFIGGGTPSSSNSHFWNGSIPWVSSSDLEEDNIHSIKISRFITEEAINKSSTKFCEAPLVLIVSRVGVGKVAYSNESICTSQDFTNIVNFKCNGLFLSYFLSVEMKNSASSIQGTSIKGISSSEIKSKKLFIPNDEEQQKIASFLSLIDVRISTQSKIIEHLESLIFGLAKQLLSLQLRFNTQDGGDYPDWNAKQLKQILTIGSGRDYKHLAPGKIPVFGTGGLMTYVDKFLYEGETVCIGRKGTIDKPMYYNGKIWTVDTLFYTHSFVESEPKFIYHTFRTINWKEYNEASGVPSLSKSTIEKIQIEIPSFSEQKKIANFLSSVEAKIIIEKQILSSYQTQKNCLLDKLFI